jgi:hypothetical protein
MSRKDSILSNPEGSERIPVGTLAYFRARDRWRVYEFVLGEFQKSGLTKAELARRLGKRPEVVSRLLGAPGNWTLDTVSDLLFAISGAEPAYRAQHPLDQPRQNMQQPEWLMLAVENAPVAERVAAATQRYDLTRRGIFGTRTGASSTINATLSAMQ